VVSSPERKALAARALVEVAATRWMVTQSNTIEGRRADLRVLYTISACSVVLFSQA